MERIQRRPAHCKKATKLGVNASQTIKGHFAIDGQYHYTMETQTAICVPGEHGTMDVYSSTQWLDIAQMAIAQMLNVKESSINMIVRRIGGGFGAKVSRASLIACAAALACYRSQVPIRFVMTLESNMETIGMRYPLSCNYSVDVDDNGKIQTLTNNFVQDYGCNETDPVLMITAQTINNCYLTDTWTVNASLALTDSASKAFCRAPGSLEGIAMIENMMEHIAAVTGKDSMDVRFQNMAPDNPIIQICSDFKTDIGEIRLIKFL